MECTISAGLVRELETCVDGWVSHSESVKASGGQLEEGELRERTWPERWTDRKHNAEGWE